MLADAATSKQGPLMLCSKVSTLLGVLIQTTSTDIALWNWSQVLALREFVRACIV